MRLIAMVLIGLALVGAAIVLVQQQRAPLDCSYSAHATPAPSGGATVCRRTDGGPWFVR
jgi:hypothetical protein